MLQGTGKVKGKWERGQIMTVLCSEVCLWYLFKGRNTLWIKCPMQILIPSHQLPAHPTRSSQASQTGSWRLAVRHVSSTTASKTPSQHHVVMEEAKTLLSGNLCWCCGPWQDYSNSFNSEKPWSLLKCKRSQNWSSQLHNWGTVRRLTEFTFKFLPKDSGIAAG